MSSRTLYFDNNATTPLDPRALAAMMPFLTDHFANAASTHPFGLRAHEAVKEARQQMADLLGGEAYEYIFTSGATEAIKGIAEHYGDKGKHIVTVQTEHAAVLDVCRYLETRGFEVSYLPVQADGLLDLEVVKSAIRPDTILVSVMAVNNEIGVIQPVKAIADLAHQAGALFMTDATQAVGKMPLNVDTLDVDLLSFSAHKLYGPKGVGGLFVRQRRPRKVKLGVLLHGGGHERGFRSGTLNVPGIVGLGKAAEICHQEMSADAQRIGALRDQLESALLTIPGIWVNGTPHQRLYNLTNIRFEGCDSDAMMMGLEGIAVSNGSACTSASVEPSHVLMALGQTEAQAFSALRFSLGRFNTEAEIGKVAKSVRGVVEGLRLMV
jgi:cysteine desulfurase